MKKQTKQAPIPADRRLTPQDLTRVQGGSTVKEPGSLEIPPLK